MSRTRRRDWPQYWPWSRWTNLLFKRILKERGINANKFYDYYQDRIDQKSLPNKLFFGKVYSDYHGSYRWAKKISNKKYRLSQKQELRKQFDEYIESKDPRYIYLWYSDY